MKTAKIELCIPLPVSLQEEFAPYRGSSTGMMARVESLSLASLEDFVRGRMGDVHSAGGGVAPAFWADVAVECFRQGFQRRTLIMSLRDRALPSKQSPVTSGDCFATCARNDMQTASLRQLQSATEEEVRLSPSGVAAVHACLDEIKNILA